MAISPVSALNAPTNLTGEAQNRFARPATARPEIQYVCRFPLQCEGGVRSAQVQTKHRNLRQAISSQRAHSIFVYARSMRAVSMLCSLRPLLASSIITKPDLLPVGFAGLGHSAGGFLPPAFFVSSMDPRHSKTPRLHAMDHGRSLKAAVQSAASLNSK